MPEGAPWAGGCAVQRTEVPPSPLVDRQVSCLSSPMAEHDLLVDSVEEGLLVRCAGCTEGFVVRCSLTPADIAYLQDVHTYEAAMSSLRSEVAALSGRLDAWARSDDQVEKLKQLIRDLQSASLEVRGLSCG